MDTVLTSLSVYLCRFQDDRGYVLYPQIGDRLDLICPASNPQGPRSPSEYEYYKLYLVSTREQADRCEVMGAPNLLLTCDKPNNDMRFTIKFQEFSPNLWGHEFKTLTDYYIIGEGTCVCVCVRERERYVRGGKGNILEMCGMHYGSTIIPELSSL